MYFYTDDATNTLLNSTDSKVLLYGGFEGFDNYGDVLQLKGAIKFHRKRKARVVIVVLSLAAWTHPGLLELLRQNYDADGFVFEDADYLDVSALGLDRVTSVQAGSLLHIYGGGFFNEYWGARRAFVSEQIIFGLRAREYVISGIQVDESGAESLRSLFELKQPLIVGARDAQSAALLARHLPDDVVRFSFDDSVEVIEDLDSQITRLGTAGSTADRSFGLHMNLTSEYMASEQRTSADSILESASQAYPNHFVTLLHAYNDKRHVVRDTLESVGDLASSHLFSQFSVINFATLATMPSLPASFLRRLRGALERIDFVITASYHIALTMNLLGKPTFLLATNDYYRDKRMALGLASDIEVFLSDPRRHLQDFASERRSRREWLNQLAAVIDDTLAHGWSESAALEVTEEEPAGTVAERYFVS